MVFIAIICNFIWLHFWLFRPLSAGLLSEQNSEIIKTKTPPVDTTVRFSYACDRPKQKATITSVPQPQLREEAMPERHLYPGATTKVS